MSSTAQEFYEQGKIFLDQKKYDEALSAFEAALNIEPNNANYLSEIAFAYYGLDKYEEGMNAADRALSMNKNCSNAYRARALLNWYFRNDKSSVAFQDINRAIELAPTNYKLYIDRGRKTMVEHVDQALIDFQHAVNLNPTSAEAN